MLKRYVVTKSLRHKNEMAYKQDEDGPWVEFADAAALQAENAALREELAKAKQDAARLDFVIDRQAFIMTLPKRESGLVAGYQLMVQDEDEDFHELSGDGVTYRTKREAIDAAMKVAG